MEKTRKTVEKAKRSSRAATNAGKRFPAEILTEAEVAALLKACSPKAPTGIRNRALISVMYRAGLRVSEALALCPKDVDSENGSVTVLHGKGNKRRTVGLDPGAFAVLARWMDRRTALGLNGRYPIFCTLKGASLKPAYVRALLPRLATKAGIEKRVHPHGLRHTHAAELAREGTPLNLVQAQLGHSSLATTDRYLKHIAPEELVKAMKARIWTPPED
jgi:site-specific recombinase XerD